MYIHMYYLYYVQTNYSTRTVKYALFELGSATLVITMYTMQILQLHSI